MAAWALGELEDHASLVVLGGDKSVGVPRSVEHAWQLREMLRARDQALTLGDVLTLQRTRDRLETRLLPARAGNRSFG